MIGSLRRVASLATLCVVAAVTASGQTAPQGPPAKPLSSAIERSFSVGTPVRQVQTRTESNGREVITETTERPDLDGRMKPALQTTTETVKTGDTSQIKHDVYAPDANGRQKLVETTQAEVQTSSNGSSRSVSTTFTPDVNGRLTFSSREVQETTAPSANVKQTNTSIFQAGINSTTVETERLQQTEKKVSAELTQNESTRYSRDGTGRWQATETRNEEVRATKTERVSEETVRRLNDAGALTVSEKTVTKQARTNSGDETVTETYSANVPGGLASSSGRLELDQRVRQTTSTTGGVQQIVREVEGRKRGSPNEPLRVIERTVETVRQTGPNQWEVQREVFALDGNGRLVPVTKESGKSTGK